MTRSRRAHHLVARLLLLALLGVASLLLTPTTGLAQDADAQVEDASAPFDREWAISAYAATLQGDYTTGGAGGKLRYEPLSWFGLEVYAEAHYVEWPGTIRHDYPIGFNLYTPWAALDWLRVRPLFGMCAVFSFIEPANEHAPRADDVLFGVHGGAGLEFGLDDSWSLFFDTQAQVYFGHDRAVHEWTGSVGEEIEATVAAQMSLGVQWHL